MFLLAVGVLYHLVQLLGLETQHEGGLSMDVLRGMSTAMGAPPYRHGGIDVYRVPRKDPAARQSL
jgi:hypothetical protein